MGLYPGGLISRIIYSFENGWAYIWGDLKPGGGLKSGILRYTTNFICNGGGPRFKLTLLDRMIRFVSSTILSSFTQINFKLSTILSLQAGFTRGWNYL